MPNDYYAILGVPRNATPEQIRKRFLELARSEHPDRFQGAARQEAEVRFQAITEAFNVLSNPERRRRHDLELARPETTQQEERQRLVRFYLESGVRYYRERNYAQAAEAFDRAVGVEPNNAQAWHHFAQAAAMVPRYRGRALEAIVRACELNPMNPSYLKLAGKLHFEAGKYQEAERYYNEALTWGGEDSNVAAALEEIRKMTRRSRGSLFWKGS
jgi:curved DNA-binding protein CbpA